MRRAHAVYRALLHGYPAPFRHEYGEQMRLMFAEQLGEARRTGAWGHEAQLWARAVLDLLTVAPREHWHVLKQDLRYAFRSMKARPGFASVAILSLALGIGANTAIFSLWNSVLNAALPGVDHPQALVMLSNPNSIGMMRGRWNTRTDGPRSWLSYAEFEQLRDQASVFSMLMASETSLSTWQGRVDRGQPESIRGRLVSGGFFQVLGAQPAIGRLFTTQEDSGEPAYAVISHAYWQRRFGGRPDVIGRTLSLRDTVVAITGVTRAGFVGETSGQLPDVWLPIRLQPRVLPPGDWLHEQPPDKMMWLHVFGRLKPGVSESQAEAQANAIFQTGLESFYGAAMTARQREFLDQRLVLQSAARGASSTRQDISSSLRVLLVAVGILLLIACANLANLLLARGAARRAEVAIRLSLGASRARLIRQLVTESLALSLIGGIVAIGVAYALHRLLVAMLREVESQFFMSFAFDVPMLVFALAATIGAAVAFGALPAWQMTRSDPGAQLKDSSRGAIGSVRELRSGRWLVGVQLVLSLPLLVAAGLLVRTAYNLQHADLGFRPERLLLARVDLGTLAQDVARRDRLLRDLRTSLERIPGVEAATFSHLGLFGGGFSTAMIEVEGVSTEPDPEGPLDRVGAGYFTTLGIPIRRGRDISETDGADTRKVCVINDAFSQRFFDRRDPMGLHVTTVGDDGARVAYEIVGIAGNARTGSLRGDVAPRFFVPAEQRPSLGTTRTFMIRAAAGATVISAVRKTVTDADSTLSLSEIASIEEQMAPYTADERNIAQLGVVFGTAALMLAAIGLYGVLSFGVARRASEIAIRIALGALPHHVIAMIVRENTALVVAGLVLGGTVTLWGSRLLEARLYGVAPQDPLTLTIALGVLLLVAFIATYLPARRASKVDPVTALRQG
jgi:predicted permease